MTWAMKRLFELWKEAKEEMLPRRIASTPKQIEMNRAVGKILPSPMSDTQRLLWRAAKRMERGEV